MLDTRVHPWLETMYAPGVPTSTLKCMKLEDVIDQVGNRFAAVVVSSRRARQINAYFHQLGEGIGHYVPPQVHSLSRKPLTIAMEEIAEGKVTVEREEG